MVLPPYIHTFQCKTNDTKPGILTPIEDYDLDMKIKRIFFIHGFHDIPAHLQNKSRGHHGHYSAKQVLIAVHGSCLVTVKNSTGYEIKYNLCNPNDGLVLPPENVVSMSEFSSDAVLLVICDKNYEDDKIFLSSESSS